MQLLLNERINDYETFVKDITAMVKEKMGEEFSARIYKVTKNNSLELDSLVLLKKGKNFAPNIYLLPYYESYVQGTEIGKLVDRLCNIYQSCSMPVADEEFSYQYEDIKSFIVYRLVSYERNRKLLEKIPHIKYLDLAVTYHCLVRNDEDGIGTIRITNEHMQLWNASLEELHILAVKNTQMLLPHTIRSMDEVIRGMLNEEMMSSTEEGLPEEMLTNLYTETNSAGKHKMYILTNQKGINGATCLLYENVLHEFSNRIHSDFFILPSSIHEVILVPCDISINKEALAQMVREVNQTQVAGDEVLSDKVYYFSGANNALTM
jgi:hypothetical protein